MDLIKKSLVCALLAFVFTGCTTVTNLTATKEPRNATGLYRVETTWTTDQATIISESIRVFVVIGTQLTPMTPVPVVQNRWEAFLPVPPDQNSIRYRFKYDFDYNAMGGRRKDSILSQEFKLNVADKR
jgi:uncharacterized protein YceK